jgi:hypothetical protein
MTDTDFQEPTRSGSPRCANCVFATIIATGVPCSSCVGIGSDEDNFTPATPPQPDYARMPREQLIEHAREFEGAPQSASVPTSEEQAIDTCIDQAINACQVDNQASIARSLIAIAKLLQKRMEARK